MDLIRERHPRFKRNAMLYWREKLVNCYRHRLGEGMHKFHMGKSGSGGSEKRNIEERGGGGKRQKGGGRGRAGGGAAAADARRILCKSRGGGAGTREKETKSYGKVA